MTRIGYVTKNDFAASYGKIYLPRIPVRKTKPGNPGKPETLCATDPNTGKRYCSGKNNPIRVIGRGIAWLAGKVWSGLTYLFRRKGE